MFDKYKALDPLTDEDRAAIDEVIRLGAEIPQKGHIIFKRNILVMTQSTFIEMIRRTRGKKA